MTVSQLAVVEPHVAFDMNAAQDPLAAAMFQLRRAEVATRALDGLVWAARYGVPEGRWTVDSFGKIRVHRPKIATPWRHVTKERFTYMVEQAALAVEPGYVWRVSADGLAEIAEQGLHAIKGFDVCAAKGRGATPAIGLCLAALELVRVRRR